MAVKLSRPLADLGLPAGRLVWVATARRGIEAHHYQAGAARTPCGRNQLDYGTTACVVDAVQQWSATACPRCWPADAAAQLVAGGAR